MTVKFIKTQYPPLLQSPIKLLISMKLSSRGRLAEYRDSEQVVFPFSPFATHCWQMNTGARSKATIKVLSDKYTQLYGTFRHGICDRVCKI